MTREEAIEYWEQFNAEIDDLYDACSDADRDVLVKQREIVEYTISALRQQDVSDKDVGKMTNAQKIRSMSDEELAGFLSFNGDVEYCHAGMCKAGETCRICCLKWLQQPAEEDDHE